MQSNILSFFNNANNTSSKKIVNKISSNHNDNYTLFFDGCSKSNPGPAAAGAVIFHNDVEIWSSSVFVGKKQTNNAAEYTGLIIGLREVVNRDISRIVIKGDSKLIIQQMKGLFKVKSPNLIPLYQEAKNLAHSLKSVSFHHVYRHLNTRADELANLGLL